MMLESLKVVDVGPAPQFEFELGSRVNLFTGDNGLGKSFALEAAFFVITGGWPRTPIVPQRREGAVPVVQGTVDKPPRWQPIPPQGATYDFSNARWDATGSACRHQEIVLYLAADNSVVIWDMLRCSSFGREEFSPDYQPDVFRFSERELWDGVEKHHRSVCNGLIRDWVSWQRSESIDPAPFQALRGVLRELAPHPDREPLVPGPPQRVDVRDARDHPTLQMPYGTVPATVASAGFRRILTLAYAIVWAWREHLEVVKLKGGTPTQQMVLLIDEAEAHLHPQWQRRILPALLRVCSALSPTLKAQLLITTHSPLVLASMEPHFDEATDRLFGFELDGKTATAHEIPWARQGDVLAWLHSLFGLEQGRSLEAERAIEAAEAWMRGEKGLPANLDSRDSIDQALRRLLPDLDPFWPRWVTTPGSGL